MTVVPRFNLPVGTQVRLQGSELSCNGMTDDGYAFTELATGTSVIVPFQSFIEYQKLPGARIDALASRTGDRLRRRLSGFPSARALSAEQQEVGRFHLSLCHAMMTLRETLRSELGRLDFDLSIQLLDKVEHRKFIKEHAQPIFGNPICINAERGGKHTT